MELTVLTDNNTFIDQYYCGEPAVCFHIKDNDTELLLDTGYSDVFIKNAESLKLNLTEISTIVFSHGHNDHTGGLKYLFDRYDLINKNIIAHPHAFKEKEFENKSIGSPIKESYLIQNSKLTLSKTPVKISKNITFLGEIPSSNSFEIRKPFGTLEDGPFKHEDLVMDDSAIVYNSGNGLFIITGCSHSGICNIIEYAKKVCNEDKIIGIIGGLHLFEVSPQLSETINYFKHNNIKDLYPCHCVSFNVKAEIHKYIPIHEVGVGLKINI